MQKGSNSFKQFLKLEMSQDYNIKTLETEEDLFEWLYCEDVGIIMRSYESKLMKPSLQKCTYSNNDVKEMGKNIKYIYIS